MIQYGWALYEEKPVHISEVTPEMRKHGLFSNVVTGQRMVAYLNGRATRHFRHYGDGAHSYETYLHQAAKLVFADTYEKCLNDRSSFILEFYKSRECIHFTSTCGLVCKWNDALSSVDLTERYTLVKVERNLDEFRPDVQLISESGDVIFVEILVTHKSTQKKIQSGRKIIEIKVENEADVLDLKIPKISMANKKVNFFSFRKPAQKSSLCSENGKSCKNTVTAQFLHKSGKYEKLSGVMWDVYSEFLEIKDQLIYWEFAPSEQDYSEELDQLSRLYLKGHTIRDCRFCRFSKIEMNTKRIHCGALRENVYNDQALNCSIFRRCENLSHFPDDYT